MLCRWEAERVGLRKLGWVFIQWGGGDGERCPNFLQTFLENIDRRSCKNGSRELIPVYHNLYRKCRPSPSKVLLTLEYLEGVPSWATSSGRKEKLVRINIQKAPECLEGGNQVRPKSLPLQGMKAQSLQSLVVGRWRMSVTNLVANLWIRSRWLISATRFDKQAGVPYSRRGRTEGSY